MHESGFAGARVVVFESRRASEMASLVTRHGGVAIQAPAMREIALDGPNDAAKSFGRALVAGEVDVLVLMTGVGTRALLAELAGDLDAAAFAREANKVRVVVRGPKPAAALRAIGFTAFEQVPEPNTWVEVASALDDVNGRRVFVQEHGAPSTSLYEALRAKGAIVTPVAVYKWALPEDTSALERGLRAIVSGEASITLFTSRAQVDNAIAVASELGIASDLKRAFTSGVVASIGPVCSEALRGEGIEPDLEPEHSKMGHLVKTAAEKSAAVLEAKRSR